VSIPRDYGGIQGADEMKGEFFDLERLAEKCRRRKKWTFFVTSAPFNVERGIASWGNALAIL
jgi:hypothetical protein